MQQARSCLAQIPKRKSRGYPKGKRLKGESESGFSIFDQIQSIANRDARLSGGEKHNRLFLMSWWSEKYNRPLKDPILLSYSLEELAYEYYLSIERKAFENENIEAENDKIGEAKLKADQEWADQMEAEEAEEAEEAAPPDPALDPANAKWMQEEIEKNKKELGEDFGEDLNLNFGDE
jgi:hypothetical protein